MNMRQRLLVVMAAVGILALPRPVTAQDPVAALEAALLVRYEVAMKDVLPALLEAQADLLAARGHREDAEALRLTAQQSVSAAGKLDPRVQESVVTAYSESARRLAESLTIDTEALDADARQAMVAGVVKFGGGARGTLRWSENLAELQSLIENLASIRNPMQLRKAKSVGDAAKALLAAAPRLVSGNASVVQAIRAYAAANKLELPTDAFGDDFKQP